MDWKHTCPLTGDGVNKFWYIYTIEFYAIKEWKRPVFTDIENFQDMLK